MRAAILVEQNRPLEVADIEVPDLECGQVLVRVMASGICGAQLGEISGAAGSDPHLPHLLGHEGGGVVEKIGMGVTKVKPGDHVVMHWRCGEGIEAPFPKYRWGDKIVGAGRVTTFNKRAIVSENRLTPIEKDIPFEIAALMGCCVTTGLGLINNEARLKIGQSIAVAGCGGVGMATLQGARLVSAYPVIGIDIHAEKLVAARVFGASHVVRRSDPSDYKQYFAEIRRIAGERGVDVWVDCTGNTALISEGYELTAPGGKTILVGQPGYRDQFIVGSLRKHYRGQILMDSQGGLTRPDRDIPRYLKLYREDLLHIDEMITHRFHLNQINDAIEMARSGKAIKCMLIMG